MLKKILNSKSKSITFAAFLLAGSAIISRLLGLLRDRLLAGHFGAGPELDIYFSAFRIPDFIYAALIAGGTTAAFLPIFSEYFHKSKERGWSKEAIEFTNNFLNAITVFLLVVCGILAIFTPLIVRFIVPGFSIDEKDLAITMTRIMFLSPIFFGIASVFSGILQYFNKFLIYSLAPIVYNLGIIFGIIFLVPRFGIYGLAYGVVIGAILYFIIQIPSAIHSGFNYRLFFNFRHKGVLQVLKLTAPRIVGTVADQLNLIVYTAVASTIAGGSIAIFAFSNNLAYLPIGIVGLSFAVPSFAVFSKHIARGEKNEFLEKFGHTFCQIMFFVIPFALLIFILRAQIVRLVLGTGNFGWNDTRLTAAVIGILCFGALANSIIPLITKAFFAFQDTKRPVIIAICSSLIGIALVFIFKYLMFFPNSFSNFVISFLKLEGATGAGVVALPLAAIIAANVQFFVLLFYLFRKIGDFRINDIISSFNKILVASIFMSLVAYVVRQWIGEAVDLTTFTGVLYQFLLSSIPAILIYFVIAYYLKSPEIKNIYHSFISQFNGSKN